MGRYFPNLPTRQLAQMGNVDDNPVHLTAEEEYWTKVKVAFLWGRSNGNSGEHPKGLALDFSVLEYGGGVNRPGPAHPAWGNTIANWLWTNRRRLGVWYVIWNRKIISTNPGSYAYGRWTTYRGSNPHTDHVHVSFYAANIYQPPSQPKEWDEMATKAEIKELVRDVVRDELEKFAADEVPLGPTQQRITGKTSRSRDKLWSGAWAQSYDAAQDDEPDAGR